MKGGDDHTKHRMKLHMKVLGTSSQQRLKENKPTYKEKFVPPEVSMISYFMTKVSEVTSVMKLYISWFLGYISC